MSGPLPPRPRGWWRSNARSLVVVAVLVPAIVFVLLGLPLIDIAARQPTIIVVPSGESVEAGGFRWTVEAAGEFVGDGVEGNGIPSGAAIAAAVLAVEPVDGTTLIPRQDFCDFELTRRAGVAEEQVWEPELRPSQYRYELGEDSTDFCGLGDREALELEAVFLTPVGALEHATLDVGFIGESTILRFELEQQ